MKLIFVTFAGLILSLSALSSQSFQMTQPSSPMSADEIQQEMKRKFQIRDTFVEKGNSLKYIKVHH